MKCRNHYSACKEEKGQGYEKYTLPSVVIENQSMTVSEMMSRYRGGQSIPVSSSMHWAEEDGEEFKQLNDLTDLDETKAKYDEINKKLEIAKRANIDAKKKEEEERQFEMFKKRVESEKETDKVKVSEEK